MNFLYYLPVNLIFGQGKIKLLGEEARKYGKRALLVTGTSSTKATGVLERAITILEESGVEAVIYDKVTQNPTSAIAYEGCRIAKEESCDLIVGLGGGSIMDCAKAIGFMMYNEGDIFDYIFGIRMGERSLPLILVPTTCGTGSEGNCFAVLTNPENNDKKSLRNIASVAKASIVDPELMTTMPKKLLATVGYDALCHSMEAYLSTSTQPLVEIQALYAIEKIIRALPLLYKGEGKMEDFEDMSLASTIGGMSIHMAGVIAPHGMEHPVSGLRDIVHGNGLAALSPVIYESSIAHAPVKFEKLSTLFGGSSKDDFLSAYRYFMEQLELTTSLSKLGIKETDIDWMTENCMKVSVAAMNAHPRIFSREEVKELYYHAL